MSGLEVVGSIASVAQLAGTVYAISKTLYEVGTALSNAPSDIKDLAGDLENFSEELHLYARLLDKKHYDDQFHRLTARIIGECATICMKIDRVLRKLRSGSVWARVKWLYKEKEIVKLLTRLRDLKFSLLNILQLMKYLKADYEIDAIGGPNRSLIEGSKEEGLSKETVAQVEATRKKLAGISIAQEHDAGESRPEEKPVTHSNEKLPQSVEDAKPRSSQSIEILSGQTLIQTPSQTSELEAKASAAPSEVISSSHITAVALPANGIMQNPNLSVQSFHSAVSHMEPDHGDETIAGYYNPELAMRADDGQVRPKASIGNENANNLKADFVSSAMKHLEMSQEVAEAWAAASVARVPGMSRSGFRRQRHPAPGRGLDQPQSPQQSMQHGAGPSTSLASALIPGPQPDPQRRASTLEPSTSLEQSASLHHVDYPINSLAVPTMYDNKNLPSSSSTNMGTVSQDSPVRSPRAFAPNSTSFTNLTSPSAYSESPEYNGDFDASPHVNIGNAQFSGDPWYPLFPNEELEVSEPLRASSRRRSSTAGSPPGSHSSISVVNSRKHDKPLPPIIVDDPNDTIAMKRARNTLAARKYRQRKMQKMEELEDEHDTSPYVNRDDTQDNDQSGPKPTKGGSSRVPGAFDDDLELTAGLQDTGFDPNIVIKDPTFQRRDSPPRSNEPGVYRTLHWETVSDLGEPPPLISMEYPRTITDLPNQKSVTSLGRSAASAFLELGFESGDGQSFNYTSPAPQLPLLRIPEESYIPSLSYTQDDSPWSSKSQQMVPPEINIEFAPASRTNSFEPPKPSLDTDDLTLSAPRRRSRAMSDPYSSSPIDPSTLSTSSKTRSNEPPENLPLPSTHSRRSSASSIPNRDHIIVLADPQHQNATLDDWNLNKRAQKHPSTFQCTLCPQTFSRSYNLRSHIKTHYGGAYDGSTTASSPQKPPPAPPSFKLWYPELPKSLWPGVFKLLARNDQSPSPQQLKELWWRAVAKLSVEDESSCKHIHGAWLAARRYHNDVTTLKAMDPTNADGDIARTSAGVLEECLSRVSDSGARSWLHRIGEILKVMRSSLDFKIGGFVWTCFCQVTIWLIHRHLGEFPDQSSTFATLADLATLIARYNVMESMYHEWPGMSLEKKYEDSLINLCTSVLQYLDKVMQVQPWLSSEPAENLASHAVRIAEADAACRGFTVTIVPEAVQSGTKRALEIGEDEEDSDSDSTVVGHELGLIPSPKRVKV